VAKNEHGHSVGGAAGSRYDRLTREELSKALDEKDQIIQKQSNEIKGLTE
jgi:hypothetical protein